MSSTTWPVGSADRSAQLSTVSLHQRRRNTRLPLPKEHVVSLCVVAPADIHVCLPSQFKCSHPSRCIPGIFRCNGQDNCGEGEDEKDCREWRPALVLPGLAWSGLACRVTSLLSNAPDDDDYDITLSSSSSHRSRGHVRAHPVPVRHHQALHTSRVGVRPRQRLRGRLGRTGQLQ